MERTSPLCLVSLGWLGGSASAHGIDHPRDAAALLTRPRMCRNARRPATLGVCSLVCQIASHPPSASLVERAPILGPHFSSQISRGSLLQHKHSGPSTPGSGRLNTPAPPPPRPRSSWPDAGREVGRPAGCSRGGLRRYCDFRGLRLGDCWALGNCVLLRLLAPGGLRLILRLPRPNQRITKHPTQHQEPGPPIEERVVRQVTGPKQTAPGPTHPSREQRESLTGCKAALLGAQPAWRACHPAALAPPTTCPRPSPTNHFKPNGRHLVT